jgi:hypothetical protein
MMMLLLAALAALVTTGSAIIAESIEYEIDGEVFEGYIAYELEWLLDPRPGEHNRLKLPSLSWCQQRQHLQLPCHASAGSLVQPPCAHPRVFRFPPPLAGVMVVHNRDGLEETEKLRARELAERGMVGFAIDMTGKGCRGDPCARDAIAMLRADPELLRARALAGLDLMANQAFTNSALLGANGYCFGGTVVLEMARVGMPVGKFFRTSTLLSTLLSTRCL